MSGTATHSRKRIEFECINVNCIVTNRHRDTQVDTFPYVKMNDVYICIAMAQKRLGNSVSIRTEAKRESRTVRERRPTAFVD